MPTPKALSVFIAGDWIELTSVNASGVIVLSKRIVGAWIELTSVIEAGTILSSLYLKPVWEICPQWRWCHYPGRYDHSTVEKEKKSSSDTGDNAKIFSPEIPLA